ncbi:ATP synthase mitochondrial F1 complex assembly factor 2 [Nymphon striatum]|nr:ATP synthase mitochondrial F1 complex assembly factor 2 [Nymphon striatum]
MGLVPIDKFEINLDKKKLKTPLGNTFQVPNEALAVAVATEWDFQEKKILQSRMHLTALCNTVIDNPNKLKKEDIKNSILSYLDTDTLCYRSSEPEQLRILQQNTWDPIINWINDRYQVTITPTYELDCTTIDDASKISLGRHILSYDDWSLFGIQYAVEVLKSVILTLATLDRRLMVEDAVSLSRLEVEYQIGKWGNVEWSHDFELLDSRARLAAAILFVHLNSSESTLQLTKQEMNIF